MVQETSLARVRTLETVSRQQPRGSVLSTSESHGPPVPPYAPDIGVVPARGLPPVLGPARHSDPIKSRPVLYGVVDGRDELHERHKYAGSALRLRDVDGPEQEREAVAAFAQRRVVEPNAGNMPRAKPSCGPDGYYRPGTIRTPRSPAGVASAGESLTWAGDDFSFHGASLGGRGGYGGRRTRHTSQRGRAVVTRCRAASGPGLDHPYRADRRVRAGVEVLRANYRERE